MIEILVALFWVAFIVALYSLHRWGTPLFVRYEMIILWDIPRMTVDQRGNSYGGWGM